MSKEKITQTILKKAQEEADRIIAEAKAKAEQILKDAEEERKRILAESEKEAKEIERKELEKELGIYEIQRRKKLLREKWKLIEEAFARAFSKIASDIEIYTSLIKRILGKDTLKGDEVVLCAPDDPVVPRIVDELNRENGWNLKLQVDKSVQKGIILSYGKYSVNYTLPMIEETIRSELEADVAKILFPRKI